jgi:hypothetical protein
VGKNGHEVRQTGQLHEASDESAEGGGRAEVDASQDGNNTTAHQGGVEGVLELGVDVAEPVGEGGGTIARNGPQGTTGGNIAASGSDQSGQESHNQKTQGTTTSSSSLVVDLGKREVVGAVADRIHVMDGVEDGDHVEDTGQETNSHLGQHSLGNVTARLGDLLSQVRRTVRGTNRVGTVQHAHDEHEALLLIAGKVSPFLPDKVVRGISGTVDVGHHGTDNDGDEDTG